RNRPGTSRRVPPRRGTSARGERYRSRSRRSGGSRRCHFGSARDGVLARDPTRRGTLGPLPRRSTMRTLVLGAALLFAAPALACPMADASVFQEAAAKVEASKASKVTLVVTGMHCGSCAQKVM